MKHIFIINPAAGKGKENKHIAAEAKDACTAAGVDFEIYQTIARGDATRFVKQRIEDKPSGEVYRFYACGGDGTLSEVVSGAVGANEVEVGCIPSGTGNDFVRSFTSSHLFGSVKAQLNGTAATIDCYAYGEGKYGINMVNIGFDCDVVAKASELKNKRFMPKSLAYIAGVLVLLGENRGCTIRVVREDGSDLTKEFQLVSAANGAYCGGGFHSAPKSSLFDGLIDISLITKVTRTELLRLIGSYKNGTHLETKLGKRIVEYTHAKKVEFIFSEPTNVCIDGEISKMERLSLEVVPSAIKFVIPNACT